MGEKSRLCSPLGPPVCDVTFPTCRKDQMFLPSWLLGWETQGRLRALVAPSAPGEDLAAPQDSWGYRLGLAWGRGVL